jgi:hypothetical protein
MLKEVYMYQLQGFVVVGNEQKVCKFQRALYGLKQVPHARYSQINSYFLSQGLNKNKEDSNMYYLIRNGKYVIILLYFDDLFVIGDDRYQINHMEKELKQAFEMTDLGDIKLF